MNNTLDFNPFSGDDPEKDPKATIVSDAFEAVTNGMYNPEAMLRLENLDSTEEIGHWKALIKAVELFYSQDYSSMEKCLGEISDGSLAGSLKPVLYQMSGLHVLNRKPSFHEEKLIKKVTEDSRFLLSAAGQLNDSIEYGGDLFIETASLLIKEIKTNNPQAAERLVLWCFEVCFERQFDEEPLADNVMMIFGQAEGLRLIALSLMEDYPESALICFTRSLIRRLIDNSIEKEEASAWLDIIDTLMSACSPSDPVFIDMTELLSMLETELSIYFGLGENQNLSSNPLEKLGIMKSRLTGGGNQPQPPPNPEPRPSPPPAVKSGEAVQLELF